MEEYLVQIIVGAIIFVVVGVVALVASTYKKVTQGRALVRTGVGRTTVEYDRGLLVIPILQMLEVMDISVKTIEVERMGEAGLICKDNMRADIKVVFFVRVNKSKTDIIEVAQTIGCNRASDPETLNNLFDAKFSEALKTVGKRFDFVELYDSRDDFKEAIIKTIGRDLNGYVLDDCAIDYLEQTDVSILKANNILDAEGIKKITELTAIQNMKANQIRREEEKTITQQDVEAKEAILELNRQLAEKEERQKREIANIKAREAATTTETREQERLRGELKRIETEEGIQVAEQNRERQIIIAQKNRERTEKVEGERVEKDRLLEVTEREKIVELAQIEKEKSLEQERREIQDVIRERIAVERKVVEEEEKIKDLQEFSKADRKKQVALTQAEEEGEGMTIRERKKAEAEKIAAEISAETKLIEAEADKNASAKQAEARKISAEALAAEEATIGLAEAQVIEAKANAREREGSVEAVLIERKAEAMRKKGLADAEVLREQGTVEANLIEAKALAEAKGRTELELADARGIKERLLAEAAGIEQKAEAMKKLDDVSREHEEFRLRLDKEKAIDLAQIQAQREIAEAQARVLSSALQDARIDIVGGETQFFNSIMGAMSNAKTVDRLIGESSNITELKGALIGDGQSSGQLFNRIKELVLQMGMSSEDVKNLSLSALLGQLYSNAQGSNKNLINRLINNVRNLGLQDESAEKVF